MDITKRQIAKITRDVNKFTVRILRNEGIGSAEFDFIHIVRKNPGITQAKIRESLSLDKGAAARCAARLEVKGYLIRKPNPDDGRSQFLFATPKADRLKNSKASVESLYFEWLMESLDEEEQQAFVTTLTKLYLKSKTESKNDFSALTNRFQELQIERKER